MVLQLIFSFFYSAFGKFRTAATACVQDHEAKGQGVQTVFTAKLQARFDKLFKSNFILIPQGQHIESRAQFGICRRRNILFTLILCSFGVVSSINAQQIYPVDLNGTLIPPHSLDLGVYSTTRNMDMLYTATLNDPIEPFRNVRLKVTIESNAQVIYSTNPNYSFPTITLQRGVPYLIDGFVLQPYLKSAALVGANNQGLGSVILPEGLTRIIVEVIDIQRNVPISRKAAAMGNFTLSEPPILQMPACGSIMQQQAFQSYTFNWIPLHIGSANNPAPVEYTFTLKEILPGQNANDAFPTALKIYERTTLSPNLIYGMTDPALSPGKMYAWQVTARNMLKGGLLFRNGGKSLICTFYIGNQGSFLTSSLEAEKEEELRLVPRDCETFLTDFGPIMTTGYSPAPIAAGDEVKIGWFELKVTEATQGGNGYNGIGRISVPMLQCDVKVSFSNLQVKANTRRVYAGSVRAFTDAANFALITQPAWYTTNAQLNNHFTQDKISALKTYFETGDGTNKLVSKMALTSPALQTIPLAFDKPGAAPVYITALRFEPRQAFITCASSTQQGTATARYGAFHIPITPYGVQTSSVLQPLDGAQSTNQVFGNAFTLNLTGGSGMKLTCTGSGGSSDSPEFTVDERIITRADKKGPVKFQLKNPNTPLNDYLDDVKYLPSFVVAGMPDYIISSNRSGNQLDLSTEVSAEVTAWAAMMAGEKAFEFADKRFIGLKCGVTAMSLPQEFDFTGQGRAIKLDGLFLNISERGVNGAFANRDLNIQGEIGSWKFTFASMVLDIKDRNMTGVINGDVTLPIFKKKFDFTSTNFKPTNTSTQFKVKPNTNDELEMLWSGCSFSLDTLSTISAVLRDIEGEGRKFMPDADLTGIIKLQMDYFGFQEILIGDKSVINNRLRALFPGNDVDFWFDLSALKVEHLRINPFKLPHERYTVEKFILPRNSLKINGVSANLADFRIRSRDATNGKPEELTLEFVIRKGTELVQINFVATLGTDGNFRLDRTEVKLDNIECRCYTEAGQKKQKPNADMGQMLERVYEKFYAPKYPVMKAVGSLSGGEAFTKAQEQAEWLAEYKAMTLERLRQNLVAGFPIVDDALTIPFLELQLPFEQEGTTYKAQKAIERTSSEFTFDAIDNLQKDGTHRLPLLLTPDLMTLMGMSNTALPDNTKLLITDFEVTGGSNLTLQSTKVEFTLLVKLDNVYAQFVRKGAKVSPEAVDMKDFYMFLDKDIALNSALFGNGAISLKKGIHDTGIPKPEVDSYALMLCEGFQKFNVQGTYAVPFEVKGDFPQGQLKIRDKTKRDPKEAEQQVSFQFRIDQGTDLNQFIAGVSNTTATGEQVSFVSADQESVIFYTDAKSEIYLDYSTDRNKKSMPDHLDDSFQGLYFVKMLGEVDGFLDELNKPLFVEINEFYFSPLSGFGSNGMGGAMEVSNLLTWGRKAKLGGWRYTIDKFSIDYTKAAFNKDPSPYSMEGRMHCPIFLEKDTSSLINYSGSLLFEKSKEVADGNSQIKYHPSGNFSVSTKGKSQDLFEKKAFYVDWLKGAKFFLKKGCIIDLAWVALEDGSQGFLPRAELNGGVNIAISKSEKVSPEFTSDQGTPIDGQSGSLEFTLPNISFQGLKINHPESDKSGRIGGTSGVKTLEFGTWGLGDDALLEKSDKKQPFMYFPITIGTPEVSWRKADQRWLMKIEIALNLLWGAEEGKSNYILETDARTTAYKEEEPAGKGIMGSTILNFKFKPGTTKAVEFAGIELEEIGVTGFFGVFEIEAIVRFIKDGNEKEWGKGVIGKGALKTEGGLTAAGILQFGRIERDETGNGSFSYFFADIEATYKSIKAPHFGWPLIITPPPVGPIDVFNLHGLGGGVWYNMEKTSPADYEAPEEKETPLGAELINGRGITGFEYKPKEFSYGGYVKGIFSIVQPNMLTLDLAIGIEVGKNNAGNMSFKKIFAQGKGYLMIESVADRDAAPITIVIEAEADINNKRLSGFFTVDAKILQPDEETPLIGIRVDPAVTRGSGLIEFKKDGKWYIKAGTPTNRMEGLLDWIGLMKVRLGAYIQLGQDLDPVPSIEEMVPGWPVAGPPQGKSIDIKNGISFGGQFAINQSFNFGVFYAAYKATAGFDLALGTTPLKCNNKPLGINGWIIKGQVYAMAGASVGLEFKLGPKRGRVVIMSATVAAVLQGQMVSPTILRGQLAGKFSVLGGLVSGSFNLRFRVASQKDIDCMNEALSNPNAALAAFPIVSEKYPDSTSNKDVPIFAIPKITYNLNIGSELQIDDVDIDGNPISRTFKPVLDPTRGFLLKKGNETIPCEMVAESQTTTLKPMRMLDPKTEYTLSWYVRWQRKINGNWEFLPDSTAEKGAVKFTTGNLPDVIVTDLLSYHAPGHRQRYWHSGYANPRIKFDKPAPGGKSWQEYYFPQSKQVAGYGLVNYDYLVRLTRYKNGLEERTYDIPLSEYPGMKSFQIPVTSFIQVGTLFTIPVVKIEQAQGLSVSYAGLADSITNTDEWKSRLCKLELVRLPILPKAETKSNSSSSNTTGANGTGVTTNIATTSLTTNESKIPLEDGFKILYRYFFATSSYTNLDDKLTETQVTAYKSAQKRTDYDHPDDATELDFAFKNSDADFPGFSDDYFGFQNVREGFDRYDLDRIRLNFKVEYPDENPVQKALWADENGAKRFDVFSELAFADGLRYHYHFKDKDGDWFNMEFRCYTGAFQLSSYKDLLQTSNQLNLTNLKKYWKSRIIDPKGNQTWTNKFLLPPSDYNLLNDAEITKLRLNYSAYSGQSVDQGLSGQVITEPRTYGLMFQDNRSRILGLQWLTMRSAVEKSFKESVQNGFTNGLAKKDREKIQIRFQHWDAWNDHFWNFKASRPLLYVKENTWHWGRWAWKADPQIDEDFSGLKSWYSTNKATYSSEQTLYYKGRIQVKMPKLNRWQDMGQSVVNRIDNYPTWQVTVYPNRPGAGNTNGQVGVNTQAVVQDESQKFKLSRVHKTITLQSWPADADIIAMEIALAANGTDYQRVVYWDAPAREADLYSSQNKRSIKYNALLPGTDMINLSELFSVPSGNGNTIKDWDQNNLYRNQQVRVRFKTAKGSYSFVGAPSANEISLTRENAVFDLQREKAIHLTRGAGSNANMLVMRKIGTEGKWDFGAFLLINNDTKEAVAHLNKEGKLTRFSYSPLGLDTAQSNYIFGNVMLQLNPQVNYAIYLAKEGQKEYSLGLSIDRVAFWQDKVGQFFVGSGFGDQLLGTIDYPAIMPYNQSTLNVPGRIEAEHFGQPNMPIISAKGLAYMDTDTVNSFKANNARNIRDVEAVDIELVRDTFAVSRTASGEWLKYLVQVTEDGNYFLRFSGRTAEAGKRTGFRVEIDGAMLLDSVIFEGNESIHLNYKKRIPKLFLTKGQHMVRFLFDGNVSLDYFEVLKLQPKVKVQFKEVEILDTSTGYAPTNGTDFGNVPCGAERRYSITNIGNGLLELKGRKGGGPIVQITGSGAAAFQLLELPKATLYELDTSGFVIRFTPRDSSFGDYLATVNVYTSAPGTDSVYTFNIKATNNPVEIELNSGGRILTSSTALPRNVDVNFFNNLPEGVSFARNFNLVNRGKVAMKLELTKTGDAADEFVVSDFPTNINAGEQATFKVTYFAKDGKRGMRNAQIEIKTEDCDENPFIMTMGGSVSGSALSFQPSSKLELPAGSLFQSDLTFEAWVKPLTSSWGADGGMLEFVSSSTKVFLKAANQLGKPVFGITRNGVTEEVTATEALPANVWTHLAVTCNDGRVAFFLNGQAKGTGTMSNRIEGLFFDQNKVQFNQAFVLDELRIWNVALGAQQIEQNRNCGLLGLEQGLKLYFRFNQGLLEGDNSSIKAEANARPDASGTANLVGFERKGNIGNYVKGAFQAGNVCGTNYALFEVRNPAGQVIPSGSITSTFTDFGKIAKNGEAVLPFQLHNIGTAATTGSTKLTLTGADANQFEIVPGWNAGALTPKGKADFSIKFKPKGNGGMVSAVLLIENPSSNSYAVHLKGSLDAPGMVLSGNNKPIALNATTVSKENQTDFGVKYIGGTWERSFIIKNTGLLPLKLDSIRLAPGASSSFSIIQPTALNLISGQFTEFKVLLRPKSVGNHEATVILPSNIDLGDGKISFKVSADAKEPANMLAFDGTDDVLETPTDNYFKSAFTIEAWVNVRQTGSNVPLLEFAEGATKMALYLSGNDNKPQLLVNNQVAVRANAVLTLNTWQHIAAVCDGTKVWVFINGEEKGTGTVPGRIQDVTAKCLIGNKANFLLDDLRVWRRALDVTEIKHRMKCSMRGNEPGLALYYNMNQGVPDAENAEFAFATNLVRNAETKGTLKNFALTGTNSNWVSRTSEIRSQACAPFEVFKIAKDQAFTSVLTENELIDYGRHFLSDEIEKVFYIKNIMNVPLKINQVHVTGKSDSKLFTVANGTKGMVLQPQQVSSFTVHFRGNSVGKKAGDLEIITEQQVWTASLSGEVSPETLLAFKDADTLENGVQHPNAYFGLVDTGQVKSMSIRLKNINSDAARPLLLKNSNIVLVTGRHASQFAVTRKPASSIAAYGQDSLVVEFRPTGEYVGTLEAALVIQTDAATGGELVIRVRGDVSTPKFGLYQKDKLLVHRATTVDFGKMTPGALKDIQLNPRNVGSGTLKYFATGPNYVITGSHGAQFEIVSVPGKIITDTSVMIVRCKPVHTVTEGAGERIANLAIRTNDPVTPEYQIQLKCNVTEDWDCNELVFDGADDYLELPPDYYLSGDFTIEANVRIGGDNTKDNYLLEIGNGLSDNVLIGFSHKGSGKPYIRMNQNGKPRTVICTEALDEQVENCFIAVSVKDGKATLVVKQAVGQGFREITGIGDLYSMKNVLNTSNAIGRNMSGNKTTYASIALNDLRIWKKALTKAEIDTKFHCVLSGNEPDLMMYLLVNQGYSDKSNEGLTFLPDLRKDSSHRIILRNFNLKKGSEVSNYMPGKLVLKSCQ